MQVNFMTFITHVDLDRASTVEYLVIHLRSVRVPEEKSVTYATNQNKSGPVITEIFEEDAGQQIQKKRIEVARKFPTCSPEQNIVQGNKFHNSEIDTRLDSPIRGPERGKANNVVVSDNCKIDTRLDKPTAGPERDETNNVLVSDNIEIDTRLDPPTCGPGRGKATNLFDSDSEDNIQEKLRVTPPCSEEVLRLIALLENPPSDLSHDFLDPRIFALEQHPDDNSEPEQASDSEWEDEVETLCEPAVPEPAVTTNINKPSQASKHPKNFPDWKILEDHLYYRRPDPLKEILGDEEEWKKRLDELRHKIESVMRKENERQEKYHGTDLKIPEVSVGDKVYYPNRKLSNKAAGYSASLGVKYLGPAFISKIISPLVVELKNERGKLLGQHYIPDLKLPRRSDRVMWRISQEIKNQREGRQRPEAAQVNTGGVRPGINSGAVQRAFLAELPSEAASTPRTSALMRLGPLVPSYDPAPAILIPSVYDRLGALRIGDEPKDTEDGKHPAQGRARSRRANRRHGRGDQVCTEISKWCGLNGNQNRLNRRRAKFNLLLENPATPKNILRKAWRRALTKKERQMLKELRPLELLTFGVRTVREQAETETSLTPVRVSIPLSSITTPPPVSTPGLGALPITPRPPEAVPGPSSRPDVPVRPTVEIRGSGSIPGRAIDVSKGATPSQPTSTRTGDGNKPGRVSDVSKGAIPRRPPTTTNPPTKSTTYVKTRVFTRSQPSSATPRRSSTFLAPVPARITPATMARSIPMELEEAAALPTGSRHAADTQAASTSTFKVPECPPHLSPAFAEYRAGLYKLALERAAKTGVMETGIPRGEKTPELDPSTAPVRRKNKKKKKRKKGELRGPNWAEMDYYGGSALPISEDSGIGGDRTFGEDSDDDVLELDHDEDL
ncbi:Protein of unknown function [Cotesia congregata]|uniref:Uncharacterized protein n=1 Tax=Cotesia congregata TaxID=51543 RepID=A0A8J2HJB4_COTCN|nr:Protein of unknown function [Cotesia congregata]